MNGGWGGSGINQGNEVKTVDEKAADNVDLGDMPYQSRSLRWPLRLLKTRASRTYHDSLAAPPTIVSGDESVQ